MISIYPYDILVSTISLHKREIHMNDKQLNTLIKTIECGSFTKAEETLFLSRQAIKKQIDSLEEELGFTLLARTHQGIALTPVGEEFCRSAKKILNEIEYITQKCRTLSSNDQVIRIASPPHPRLLLENVFAEFFHRFPHVKQQVILQPATASIDDILENRVDVAECAYYSELENFGVKYLKLSPLTYKCLIAPSHPLAGKESICLEDLSGNHIGLNVRDDKLLLQLHEHCHDISLETLNNDMQKITNLCYNGGIFISKAYFLDSMQPLISVPLETSIVPMSVILYNPSCSSIVKDFLSVVKEMYPQ